MLLTNTPEKVVPSFIVPVTVTPPAAKSPDGNDTFLPHKSAELPPTVAGVVKFELVCSSRSTLKVNPRPPEKLSGVNASVSTEN